MGRPRPVKVPRHGPQARKSGYPGSQNADSSPRAQGALGLGFRRSQSDKGEAPWAPKACGPDGAWRRLSSGRLHFPRCLGNHLT
jgi:hypothetical protein